MNLETLGLSTAIDKDNLPRMRGCVLLAGARIASDFEGKCYGDKLFSPRGAIMLSQVQTLRTGNRRNAARSREGFRCLVPLTA